MSHAVDHTGNVYGCMLIVSTAVGHKGNWLVQCMECGDTTFRTTSAVKRLRMRTPKNCFKCAPTHISMNIDSDYDRIADIESDCINADYEVKAMIERIAQ